MLLVMFFHQLIQLIFDIVKYLLRILKVDVKSRAVVAGSVSDFFDRNFVDIFFAVQFPKSFNEIAACFFSGICIGTDKNPFLLSFPTWKL